MTDFVTSRFEANLVFNKNKDLDQFGELNLKFIFFPCRHQLVKLYLCCIICKI